MEHRNILYSFENRCCERTCNEVWNICIDMDCTCRGWEAETSDLCNVRKHVMGYKSTCNGSCQIQFWFQLANYYKYGLDKFQHSIGCVCKFAMLWINSFSYYFKRKKKGKVRILSMSSCSLLEFTNYISLAKSLYTFSN